MLSDYTRIDTVPSAEDFCRLRIISGMSPHPLEGARAGLPHSCYGVHILYEGVPVDLGITHYAINCKVYEVYYPKGDCRIKTRQF